MALEKKYKKKINIKIPKNHEENSIIKMAIQNAKLALEKKLLENDNNSHFLSLINKEFKLGFNPNLIEVYDNSHMQGKILSKKTFTKMQHTPKHSTKSLFTNKH